ncbi:methyl-accepting chemotaxis protein [Paenibacillus kobensis]|uniref:methyl-accepting chemotaxis protein n=1 Tax=Paenibacillus kobensis TaxID=59841 RepID=UPI0013E305A0|nr:methyl-accepting chemotaxis protein [Paenibacillus kobensis]
MGQSVGIIRMLLKSPSRSIGTRLFIVIICVVSVIAATVGIVSYQIASRSLVDQVKASSLQTVALAGEKLDMQQQFYLNVAGQLVNNSLFIENLFQLTSKEQRDEDRDRMSRDIRGLFDQLALSDARIRDITLIPLEDPNIRAISTIREGLEVNAAASWIEPIRSAGGKEVWLPIETEGYLGSSPKPLFAFGKLLGRNNIGSHEFILLVQIEASALEAMIQGVQISPSSTIAILDAGNRIIARSGHSDETVTRMKAGSVEGPSGSYISEDSGQPVLYSYRASKLSGWIVAGTAPMSELTGAVKQIYLLTVFSIAGGFIIAVFIGLWLIRSIGRPLVHLETLMSKAASGDFRGRLNLRGRDEIGKLSGAYNRMMQQIGSLVSEAYHTVDHVLVSSKEMADSAVHTARAANEIDEASKQIASGASGLAVNAESSSGNVMQMGVKLSEALLLQERMESSAQEADAACRRGEATITGFIQNTNETERRMATVSDRIEELSGSVGAIRDVLRLMTHMAKQIKILSLNAMIEASRAGTAGAGFKVIASEIGILADHSSQSIGQVQTLTVNVEEEMSATVLAMLEANPLFQQMVSEVYGVQSAFDDIQNQMLQLIQASEEVSASLTQLTGTQEMLASSIEEVAYVAQQTSSSTEQVVALCTAQAAVGDQLVELSSRLITISDRLREQMASFQVNES